MLETLQNRFIYILNLKNLIKICKKILWEIIKKYFTVNQQVTTFLEMKKELVGTSETTCDITFCFNDFIKNKPEHIKINKKFLEWFIGFVEGSGSFVILKNKVYFDITQSFSNVSILYYIKKNLGFGKVCLQKDKNIAYFYVSSQENFFKIVLLFNGNLCSNYKKEQFTQWLLIFNIQYNVNISLKTFTINKLTFETGWLAGFIDAKGYFNVDIINLQISCFKVRLEFILDQKNKEILDKIKFLIIPFLKKNKFQFIFYDKNQNNWLFLSSFFKHHLSLIRYLKLFPLKTKKSLVLKKWIEIFNLITTKKYLTVAGLQLIKKKCKSINKFNKIIKKKS